MTAFCFLLKKTSKKLTALNLKIFFAFHPARVLYTPLNFI